MSIQLRLILLLGAVATLMFFLQKIRKNRLDIDYAIFWVFFSIGLVLMGVFPGIIIKAANMLGFESPANMVFLVVEFLLIIKLFSVTIKLSQLEQKARKLVQHIAIEENKQYK